MHKLIELNSIVRKNGGANGRHTNPSGDHHRYLKISKSKVYYLFAKNQLPHIRIGRDRQIED